MLTSVRAADLTRQRLKRLEDLIASAQRDDSGTVEVRELEIRSRNQLANQLREELSLFKARTTSRVGTAS